MRHPRSIVIGYLAYIAECTRALRWATCGQDSVPRNSTSTFPGPRELGGRHLRDAERWRAAKAFGEGSLHKRIPDLQLLLDRHGVVHRGQDPFLQTGEEKIVQKFDGARTYLLRSPEVESPVSIADILGGVEQLQQTEDSMYRLAVLAALLLLGWRPCPGSACEAGSRPPPSKT